LGIAEKWAVRKYQEPNSMCEAGAEARQRHAERIPSDVNFLDSPPTDP